MVKIDYIIFGYRTLNVSKEKLTAISSILFKNNISSTIDAEGSVLVRERDIPKLKKLLKSKAEYELSECKGIPGLYKKMPHKPWIISSVIVSFIFVILLSNLVWDIRIEGNQQIPDSKIAYELSASGLELGKVWSSLDKTKIETDFLLRNKNISWININRRGTVAYVTVIEKEEKENLVDDSIDSGGIYTNILSSVDCIIEEITVTKGTVMVKVGDVVKKGDLLIAGIIPSEKGSEYCKAEGKILGRMIDRVYVDVSREQSVKTKKSEKVHSVYLNFFNFSLNIFKIYRNLSEECVIIEKEESLSLFNVKLPFSYTVYYYNEYLTVEERYSDADLVRLASRKLESAIVARLTKADLSKIRTYGEYTEDGYRMYSEVVFTGQVGVPNSFEVGN